MPISDNKVSVDSNTNCDAQLNHQVSRQWAMPSLRSMQLRAIKEIIYGPCDGKMFVGDCTGWGRQSHTLRMIGRTLAGFALVIITILALYAQHMVNIKSAA